MHYSKRFLVKPGHKFKLADIDPDFHSTHEDEAAAKGEIVMNQEKLRALQYRMYAENKRSLLVCLQAMDAGGKDGTIQHVMAGMNPQGCRVQAFKTPSAEEAAHDFLWRVHKAVGSKGMVTVFNRSHYEDVLVVRVHKLVPKKVWSPRYSHINNFEKELSDSGMHILKFFLHISKEEQLARFKERLNDPTKQWKISESDYLEREYWDDYMKAYEDAAARVQHGRCALVHHSVQSQMVPQSCGFTDPGGTPRSPENGISQADSGSEEDPTQVSSCGKRSAQP
jgi:PPK2 family polyphosphate:nucleotide phosphotransferase